MGTPQASCRPARPHAGHPRPHSPRSARRAQGAGRRALHEARGHVRRRVRGGHPLHVLLLRWRVRVRAHEQPQGARRRARERLGALDAPVGSRKQGSCVVACLAVPQGPPPCLVRRGHAAWPCWFIRARPPCAPPRRCSSWAVAPTALARASSSTTAAAMPPSRCATRGELQAARHAGQGSSASVHLARWAPHIHTSRPAQAAQAGLRLQSPLALPTLAQPCPAHPPTPAHQV